jgi:hypothetical protein
MAETEDLTQVLETADAVVEMAGNEENPLDVEEDIVGAEADGAGEYEANAKVTINPQTIFLDYLKSPIVELLVGGSSDSPAGEAEPTLLTAHQAILTQSPYFASALSELDEDAPLHISLLTESLDAITCFLQYQYTSEYFPRRLPSIPDGLEPDPSLPAIDDTGAQLLKHARVYTLAEKLGLPELKTLAHSKIHRINSTAVGEIAYARYVYGNTAVDDTTIRRPVAAFWATRSHVLRHEAGSEFQAMCLEYPQFGFDVLSLVLDQKEKRARDRDEDATPGGTKGRKRMRPSVNV